MNWNLNYWTILFAIATTAATFLFFYPNVQEVSPTEPEAALVEEILKPCDTIPELGRLTSFEALERIYLYEEAFDSISSELAKNKSYKNPLSNFEVRYFHLPHCELQQMLEAIPDSDVFAHLAVVENPKKPEDKLLTLIFADQPYREDGAGPATTENEILYFDFVTPCPPTCLD